MTEDDPQKVAAILQDYAETLEVLTINSKPLINDLTMAADRYKPLAPQIVQKIESRLFEVPANQKLPLLYLLDSIMKNLRGHYLEVVNARMVAIFCHCFEKLTEPKTRISLYKLRQTWNPFIGKKKLAAIDKHVHALDPNWPVTATDVTAPTSPTIHVNPEFLLAGDRTGKKVPTTSSTPNTVTVTITKTPPNTDVKLTSSANELTTSGAPPTLEQRRKHVLEAQKRKKEQLKAKGAVKESSSSASSATVNSTETAAISSLPDPRKLLKAATSSSPASQVVVGKEKKKASLSPKRDLSTRSSLSPDYDSRSDTKRRRKLSPRPRSASPIPTTPPNASSTHHRGKKAASTKRNRHIAGEEEKGKSGGIGEILKTIDISSLMGSIQKVKKQTEREKGGSSLAGQKHANAEDDSTDSKVEQPPPEKKPKVKEDATAATSLVNEDVGVADVAEDDDVIPKIKSYHLNLDDIPVELLPTHQEKIMKQVERQLKSGRLSEEQHSTLVKQLDQLYALQRKKENDRENKEPKDAPSGPSRAEQLPGPTGSVQTDHSSLSSNSLKSVHTSHTNHPHHSVPGSRPPPDMSESDFRPLSPPPRAPTPHPLPPAPVGRHPHSRSHPPHDRYPPHHFTDHHRGPRPYRGRGPRGRRPYDRPPRHSGRPKSEWHERQPPERWRDREESPPINKNALPPNQGNVGLSDPSELFSKLVELGIIKGEEGKKEGEREREGSQEKVGGAVQPLPPPEVVGAQIPLAIPTLTFTVATLKKPYSALVRLMYAGDPCATCGLRFRDRKMADYSGHLDWHYRVNSKDKSMQRSRNWFLHPEDWLKFEESSMDDENREPLILEREVEKRVEGGEGEGEQEEGQETSCEVLPGEESEVCTICAEPFEQFWEEELEEWHFREALREEGKLYHTYCYQDAKESGSLDTSAQQSSPVAIDHKPLTVDS